MAARTAEAPKTAKKVISVRMDATLAKDLEIFKEAGMSTSDAIKWSVNWMAQAFATAWKTGTTPYGQHPSLVITVEPSQDRHEEPDHDQDQDQDTGD